MAYDPATYKVNLDTPQPDGRKGESPRNAFTKYNALVDALKNAPSAPASTTTNNVPQWSNTVGGLKDGLGLSTSSTLSGNSDSNVPSEKAVKTYVDNYPKPQDFGVGASIIQISIDMDDLFTNATLGTTFIYSQGGGDGAPTIFSGNITTTKPYGTWGNQWYVTNTAEEIYIRGMASGTIGNWVEILHTKNTTVDGNGFIKSASPIIKLTDGGIVKEGDVGGVFSKVSTGVYTISGTTGLRVGDGWYLETPTDRNGNKYFNVDWEQDIMPEATNGVVEEANVKITIKVYERVWNPQTGIFENGNPMDIPSMQGRWIDLRLNELPTIEENIEGEPQDG